MSPLGRIFVGGLCLFGIFMTCSCQSYDDSVSLMEDMLDGYNRKIRPVTYQTSAILVNVSFEMVFVQDLNELTGKFTAFGVFILTWFDEKIVWDPSKYGGIWSQLFHANDVWYPPLVATTSYGKIEDIADDWMTVRIFFYGYAYFSAGKVIKSVCNIDVTYYPFDTQDCTLTFYPWGLWTSEINLHCPSPYAAATYYTEGGEWAIIANSTTVDVHNNFYIKVKMKRKPLFAVVNIILPIVLMSVLNVLVFVLPPESGERVSYGITVLLSTAVFLTLVADNLPKTSQPMSVLAYFLMANLTNSTLMCVAAILNLRVYFKKDTKPIPIWLRNLVRIVNCQVCYLRTRFKRNDVVPIDLNEVEEEKGKEVLKHESHNVKDEDWKETVTWQDVASAIDMILFMFFIALSAASTTVFVVFMSQNKGSIQIDMN